MLVLGRVLVLVGSTLVRVSPRTCMPPHFVGSLFKSSRFIFIGYYPMVKENSTHKTDWDRKLPSAIHAYNTSEKKTTG